MADIFISYSRADRDFVQQLVRRLTDDRRDVWVDFEDIPFATDWWGEICGGIEASETVIFVLSPASLDSEYCSLEVNHALKNAKRIIPIVCQDVEGLNVPANIAALHWIFFTAAHDADGSFRQLIMTLDTDLEELRQHTRVLLRAREWETRAHDASLLARGVELIEMEQILGQPNLTDLQRAFLQASRREQTRRELIRRFWLGFAGGALGIGFYVFTNFRSDSLFSPLRVAYAISYGQIFGVFIGAMSVLAEQVPAFLRGVINPRLQVPFRAAACALLALTAWWLFRWYILALSEGLDATLLLGMIGLSIGFIARVLIRAMPGWAAFALTAAATYAAIFITYEQSRRSFDWIALIYFENDPQVISVGIPMALMIALGANAQALSDDLRQLYRQTFTRRTSVRPAPASI